MRWFFSLLLAILLAACDARSEESYEKFDFREDADVQQPAEAAEAAGESAEAATEAAGESAEAAAEAAAEQPAKTSRKKKTSPSHKKTSHKKTASKKKDKAEKEDAKPVAKPQEDQNKERPSIEKTQIMKLERMKEKFPENPLIYYESVHFFYLTDAPQNIAVECIQSLENAYASLQGIFNIPAEQPVWQGKCMVVAFINQNNFMQFETHFFNTQKTYLQADALAHLLADGNVLISTYYGDLAKKAQRWKFLSVMVHEMTHGFMHRYKSQTALPLWLDEGIADYTANRVVPESTHIQVKQKSGLKYMRTTNSVGGMFVETKQLKVWQYGVASGMVGFMVKANPKAFSQLFEMLKAGETWPNALQKSYHCSPEELLKRFGQANGIQDLSF